MAKFKVGDKVRCINSETGWPLTPGVIYTVSQVGSDLIGVSELCDGEMSFFPYRFELVKDEPKRITNEPRVWCGICGDYVYQGSQPHCAEKFRYDPDTINAQCGAMGKPWETPDTDENVTVKEEAPATSWEHDGWEKLGQDYYFQANEDHFYISNVQAQPSKVKSDGGSTSYYNLPEGAMDLGDLIRHKGMGFDLANIFKAAYRLGQKEGTDILYDLNKIEYEVGVLKKFYLANGRLP